MKFLAVLVSVLLAMFVAAASWTWLFMLAVGALGLQKGFWDCFAAGVLLMFMSGPSLKASFSQ